MIQSRGIDHLVLAVRDLDAANDVYTRLGFTLTPRAVHPWGTGNHLVQLQGNFLELLGVVEPARIPAVATGGFSFGAYSRDFVARREGLSMLVFESRDARADRDEFAAKGLSDLPLFDFARDARLPDGATARVAFSLAFVVDPHMPEAAFFVSQQHTPQFFWKPEYQNHVNGAQGVSEVVMVADDPLALGEFFAKLQGDAAVHGDEAGLRVTTARGRISVLTPAAFGARFPAIRLLDAPATPHFAAYRIAVTDVYAVESLLHARAIPYRRQGGVIQVPPPAAFGVAIEFAGD